LVETLTFPASAALPAFDVAFARATMPLLPPPKFPQENLLHLQVWQRRL
jgi:hypothetical protein